MISGRTPTQKPGLVTGYNNFMPVQIPGLLEELQRRGVKIGDSAGNPIESLPAFPSAAAGSGAVPSTRAMERELKQKQLRGQLAVQDAINELARRGVKTKLATEPAESAVAIGQSKEALESFEKGGDPAAFKEAWRKFFPGQPLPRKDGQIDYDAGADDIQVEIDRLKKLEAQKAGVHNVTESKVKRINPQSKKEEEVLVRTDKASGKVLGETVLSSQPVSLSEQEGAAQRYAARLAFNQKILTDTEAAGFDPTAIGTTVQKFVPNRFKSNEVQAYNAAKLNWIAAVLRKESGAAIAKKEYNDADGQYFPQDGDSKAVVKQKQALRELAEEEMTKSIGPSAPDRATPAVSPPAPSAPAAKTGTVTVKNRAEADALGPEIEFFHTPDGRTLKNPKFKVAP